MRRSVKCTLRALFLATIVAAVGCGMPAKPKQFNNMMARANQKLSAAAKNFHKSITSQPPNLSGARGAFTEMETALSEARKQFDSILPPNNSPPGEVMLDKYRAFLSTQQTIMDRHIRPIWNNVQKPKPNWGEINRLIQAASQEEARAYQDLQNAHQEYCKHHNFEAKSR